MKKPRSQIAVIITFVIAAIILFIVVFINITKVSNVKLSTSQVADKTALGLASQIGSMSHFYKEKILKGAPDTCDGNPCKCETAWVSLAALIVILSAAGLAAFFFPAAYLVIGSIATAGAVAISMAMLGGISSEFKKMTEYNGLREKALFEALRTIQSDNVELKVKESEPGVFFEDSNGNGVFDSGEKVYNLGIGMPEMLNQSKVDRFTAWYYTNRLTLLREEDEEIKDDLDTFIEGLKGFIDIDNWAASIFGIDKFSYVIEQLPTLGGSSDYDITCSGASCPDWVKDVDTEQLRIVRMDETDTVYGGFLKDKFLSLLKRLELTSTYDLTFCDETHCSDVNNCCSDVNNLIEDLRMFLLKTKEVLNMPVSARLSGLVSWFPSFYDFKEHNLDRTSVDGDYTDDVYERLTRDQDYLNSWITELETLNNDTDDTIDTIVENIKSDQDTKCLQGRGAVTDQCATTIESCTCHHHVESCEEVCDGDNCTDYVDARWKGTYGTCTGTSDHIDHPVCDNGDLYGDHPGWCDVLRSSISCKSNDDGCDNDCEIPDTETVIDDSYYFQGQLSWRSSSSDYFDSTSGSTEVEQAIRILRALVDDLSKIQMTIATMADKVENFTTAKTTEPFRNEIIYAWKDKPVEGKEQFSHLVQVKIAGYPAKLPYVSESIEWGIPPQKCHKLNDYQGNFTITTSRYDQDQPTSIGWDLQRRKPTTTEFDPERLEAIVEDIQDNGTINTTQDDVDDIVSHYAITSTSQVHYGPEKSDIRIMHTEGDAP